MEKQPNKQSQNPQVSIFQSGQKRSSQQINFSQKKCPVTTQLSFTPVKKQSQLHNSQTSMNNIFSSASINQRKNSRDQEIKLIKEFQLIEKMDDLERRVSNIQRYKAQKQRKIRTRRKSSQIHKLYQCSKSKCKKHYASRTALEKHMRDKHHNQIKKHLNSQKE